MSVTSDTTEPSESTLRASRVLGANLAFVARVRVAAVKAAVTVAAEDAETENHSRRVQLANQVLMSPERWGLLMAEAVAVNATILSNATTGMPIPDTDIEYVVLQELWNAYAGAE